ncbi:fatty-acid peroxygenase [Hasllibacter halocynthiae]|uniref:Fatty-acid peroxygenase n=1 Tax=Hasllibacter halocynthiae TaxID=595589 RepID=A0A2T0X4D0_9RHOB|nr:cytochrome P450 [Hasllibacter halocynthiae]PRY93803.1 fatty-acid peroxygenase [Hasllibacter halocynthiae]
MTEDPFPRDDAFDTTPAFLREGYLFVGNRCDRFGTDGFRARLMLEEITCIRGREASELFYGGDRFTRQGAMPPTTVSLLQGKESVQALDGAAHEHRKGMFMALMTEDALARGADLFADAWREYVAKHAGEEIVLHDAARLMLTRAALAWTGVEAEDEATRLLATELGEMIDNAASFGPHYIKARFLRERCERWATEVIEDIREGRRSGDGPAGAMARHRDPTGELLDANVVAVELINLLRPMVAIGRYVIFLALELHRRPEWRRRIAEGADPHAFVQEVRRTAPFFPVIAGRARKSFEGMGHRFEEGDWVMLDLYGTNRDARMWDAPEEFRPERFDGREIDPFEMVPQGGGDFLSDHRCPGEWLTIRVMETAARLLAEAGYEVPDQDLGVDLSKMPALPASGFVLRLP